jgi:DNA-binding GntR family transcriptional regulator
VTDTVTSVAAGEQLDPGDPRPLWQQLAGIIRGQIERGELTGRVPSAVALARRYQCSRDTSLRALATLQQEGLIISTVGRGSFVVRRDGS